MRAALLALCAAEFFHDVVVPASPDGKGSCNACVSLTGQGLSQLLNIILNAGVAGGCGKICGHLKGAEATACDIVCMVVGVKEFAKAIEKCDLDPIYFCELTHLCAAGSDNATVAVLGAHADPATLPKGQTVQLGVDVSVSVPSGVGEFQIQVDGPVTQPVGQSFLLPAGLPAGNQTLGVKLTPKDDNSGDFPVVWSPGTYNFTLQVCQGECGSKHPHTKVFGQASGTFQLTETKEAVLV
jgi:hypothetical protein